MSDADVMARAAVVLLEQARRSGKSLTLSEAKGGLGAARMVLMYERGQITEANARDLDQHRLNLARTALQLHSARSGADHRPKLRLIHCLSMQAAGQRYDFRHRIGPMGSPDRAEAKWIADNGYDD